MIIATSHSAECLVAYLATCQEPLRSRLVVETGYTSRLEMPDEEWEAISQVHKDVIISRTLGFIDGWEAKEDWKDYE